MQDTFTDFDQRYGTLYREMELVLVQSELSVELALSNDSIRDGRLRFLSDSRFDIQKPACLVVQFFGRGFDVDVILLSCEKFAKQFKLELRITAEIALKARIVLQLAEIVHYRQEVLEQGRSLTVDEAAAEWIAKYAEGFAREFDKHINLD